MKTPGLNDAIIEGCRRGCANLLGIMAAVMTGLTALYWIIASR